MWREDVRPEPVMMGRLATISQAGALLDKSERTIRRMIEAGRLVPVRIKGRVYVTRKSLMGLAEDMRGGGQDGAKEPDKPGSD